MYASFFAYYDTDLCVLWHYYRLQNILCVQSFGLYDTRYIRAIFSCLAMVIEPYRPAPLKRRSASGYLKQSRHRVRHSRSSVRCPVNRVPSYLTPFFRWTPASCVHLLAYGYHFLIISFVL